MKARAIYGPPGTGKTRELSTLINSLSTEERSKTCVLAFSKAAALELVSRLPQDELGFVGTIHSFCFRMGNMGRSDVVNMRQFYRFMNMPRVKIEGALTPYRYSRRINKSIYETNKILEGEFLTPAISWAQAGTIIESYKLWKENNVYYDFEDMLLIARTMFGHKKGVQYERVIVDEAQDLSPLQWDIVTAIATKDLIIAGDDDQAIFEWSGADPHGMSGVAGDNYKVLNQSYRIPRAVHTAAQNLISEISNRVQKVFLPRPEEGYFNIVPKYHPEFYPRQHTVLCRDRFQIIKIVEGFIKSGIRYSIIHSRDTGVFTGRMGQTARALIDRSFMKDNLKPWMLKHIIREVRDEYEAFINGDDVSMPLHDWYEILVGSRHEVNYLMALCEAGEMDEPPMVQISTIHAQKGREFDHVVVIGDSAPASDRPVDSELRVWYVALTRAKIGVTFVNPHTFLNL